MQQTVKARIVYLPQRAHQPAFVIYHPDQGPARSVWMVPGTHNEMAK